MSGIVYTNGARGAGRTSIAVGNEGNLTVDGDVLARGGKDAGCAVLCQAYRTEVQHHIPGARGVIVRSRCWRQPPLTAVQGESAGEAGVITIPAQGAVTSLHDRCGAGDITDQAPGVRVHIHSHGAGAADSSDTQHIGVGVAVVHADQRARRSGGAEDVQRLEFHGGAGAAAAVALGLDDGLAYIFRHCDGKAAESGGGAVVAQAEIRNLVAIEIVRVVAMQDDFARSAYRASAIEIEPASVELDNSRDDVGSVGKVEAARSVECQIRRRDHSAESLVWRAMTCIDNAFHGRCSIAKEDIRGIEIHAVAVVTAQDEAAAMDVDLSAIEDHVIGARLLVHT